MARSPECLTKKLAIGWTGRWGKYQDVQGEEKNLLHAVGVDSQGGLHKLKVYDLKARSYMQEGKSVKIINYLDKESAMVCTKQTRMFW